MPDIVLATINARYSHAALGLRYLLANLGELRDRAALVEFSLGDRPADMAERLLALQPRILGFGVYVWNVRETAETLALLRTVRPELILVLGGPEVSHETADQPIAHWADYVIAGQADLAFAALCRRLLAGTVPPGDLAGTLLPAPSGAAPPRTRLIQAPPPPLDALVLPYDLYTDQDLAHRNLYVEASRGCPFRCAFCLSALDRSVRPFEVSRVLAALDGLWARGARRFRFVDRTFNLAPARGRAILEFFLARPDPELFVHIEMIPDHLPESLRALIRRFPPGSLQLEIGIQTFNPAVQALIDRRQDEARTLANLRFLREETSAHLHTDLIAGLPGEDLTSFAAGFDRLAGQRPHEIQVGILKRLRGAPIARHAETHGMRYRPFPPYTVAITDCMDFATLRRLERFARYWDLIGNSGRFARTLPLLLHGAGCAAGPCASDSADPAAACFRASDSNSPDPAVTARASAGDSAEPAAASPFARFLRLSDWLHGETGQTHRLALERLFELVYRGALDALALDESALVPALGQDYRASGLRRELACLGDWGRPAPRRRGETGQNPPARQARHLVSPGAPLAPAALVRR